MRVVVTISNEFQPNFRRPAINGANSHTPMQGCALPNAPPSPYCGSVPFSPLSPALPFTAPAFPAVFDPAGGTALIIGSRPNVAAAPPAASKAASGMRFVSFSPVITPTQQALPMSTTPCIQQGDDLSGSFASPSVVPRSGGAAFGSSGTTLLDTPPSSCQYAEFHSTSSLHRRAASFIDPATPPSAAATHPIVTPQSPPNSMGQATNIVGGGAALRSPCCFCCCLPPSTNFSRNTSSGSLLLGPAMTTTTTVTTPRAIQRRGAATPLSSSVSPTILALPSTTPQQQGSFAAAAIYERQPVAALVEQLRGFRRDRDVTCVVRSLSRETLGGLLTLLCSDVQKCLELCTEQRGIIVCDVFEALGADVCGDLFGVLHQHFLLLAASQRGSLAITRIFDAASIDQQELLCNEALSEFASLACDRFANFVIRRIVVSRIDSAAVADAFTAVLSDTQTFIRMTGNKHASHIVEEYVASATGSVVVHKVMLLALDSPATFEHLTRNCFANYVLQSWIRHAKVDCAQRSSLFARFKSLDLPAALWQNLSRALLAVAH